MDHRENPYTPNAGATPPALVGRGEQLETFATLLYRRERGYTDKSMIITGLRGVGKTVLLNEFRKCAEAEKWAVVEIEVAKHNDIQFRIEMAQKVRKALFAIAPSRKWKEKTRNAAGVLKSFNLSLDAATGTLSAGLGDIPIYEGLADSGSLDSDLTDLLVALGEAAREHETGVVFLLDEIQFLSRLQLEALIMAMHKTVQRTLPVALTAAGLPQLAELAGDAKSYSERLFEFPDIGSLSDEEAKEALIRPAEDHEVTFSDEAIAVALEFTEGYPYFLQEFGRAIWNLAEGPMISEDEARETTTIVEEVLDESFFRVRLSRTTELELAYLRAMADLGPEPQRAAAVAELLDRDSQQCGPIRSKLISKGLLYTPEHAYAAFTVPQFDRFLKRAIPELIVPAVRPRSSSAD